MYLNELCSFSSAYNDGAFAIPFTGSFCFYSPIRELPIIWSHYFTVNFFSDIRCPGEHGKKPRIIFQLTFPLIIAGATVTYAPKGTGKEGNYHDNKQDNNSKHRNGT